MTTKISLLTTVLVACVALLVAFPAGAGPEQGIETLVSEGDALWAQAPDGDKLERSLQVYQKVLDRDPSHYEASWKAARSCFAIADLLPETKEGRRRRGELGTLGMGFGERAFTLKPEAVEGHYYYVLVLGQYSLGISVVKALAKGLGPKYEEHIEKVLKLDRAFDYGGALRAIGRYWYEVPWPKKDVKKSITYLEESVRVAPRSIRGRVYLAESYLRAGNRGRAREELAVAMSAEPDFSIEYDAVRWKERAQGILQKRLK